METLSGDWESNNADSLYQLCLHFCVVKIETIATYDASGFLCRRDAVSLPLQVCEDLLNAYRESEADFNDQFVHLFNDPVHMPLRRINVSESNITDQGLKCLMAHLPIELNISGCSALSDKSTLDIINSYGSNLTTLHVGNSVNILESNDQVGADTCHRVIECQNLRVLNIHYLEDDAHDILNAILTPLDTVTHLDITGCSVDVDTLSALKHLNNLISLVLCDVPIHNLYESFHIIANLVKLRKLDLSQGLSHIYDDVEEAMKYLIPHLPCLSHLDLSGTNLAGFLPPQKVPHSLQPKQATLSESSSEYESTCAIPGLEGRHLHFLGLLNCSNEACHRKNIPADHVTGVADEHQVVLSIHSYIHQTELLMKGLNQLFQIFRFSVCTVQRFALQGILAAMKKHPEDRQVQISGSASLFYIVKGPEKDNLNTELKRSIVRAVLSAMENHMKDATMMRNGFLTLCHFQVPHDLLFAYRRLVSVLLNMVGQHDQEEFVQRIGVYLLNSLACQVDGQQKQLVGDLGVITTMLDMIEARLSSGVCDEVMEIAWSVMWNVTDETPINCHRFINHHGMKLFVRCLQRFPDCEELLRNMMGLIGNVAEVPALRQHLMNSEYVSIFCSLLQSTSDGIEVSYNACGVLAHLVADGESTWTLDVPSRGEVLFAMTTAIRRWKLKTKRNINYRSFEPILRLLPKYDSAQAQHWATWALCNLTKMYKGRYVSLLRKEGGLVLLEALQHDPRPYEDVRALAQQVLARCQKYDEKPEYDTSEGEDDADVNMDGHMGGDHAGLMLDG